MSCEGVVMIRRVLSALLFVMAVAACSGTGPGVGPVGPGGDVGPGDGEVDVDVDDVVGSRLVAVDERTLSGFESIVFAGEGVVTVEQGDFGLTIEADDNLLEYLEAVVIGTELRIRTAEGVDIEPSTAPEYRVVLPALTGVELAGAGSMSTGAWEAEHFAVTLSGAGDLVVDELDATTLVVESTGLGSITVGGSADHQHVEIDGMVDYEASDLATVTTDLDCRGVGTAAVWVGQLLDVTVAGLCEVSYYGEPTIADEIADGGSLAGLGER